MYRRRLASECLAELCNVPVDQVKRAPTSRRRMRPSPRHMRIIPRQEERAGQLRCLRCGCGVWANLHNSLPSMDEYLLAEQRALTRPL